MYVIILYYDVLSEVKKDLQDVFTGIGVLFKINVSKKIFPHFDTKVIKVKFDLAW
jgi:hypothetical protein